MEDSDKKAELERIGMADKSDMKKIRDGFRKLFFNEDLV